MGDKISWSGTATSVQPRIRLTRSFDEAAHSYLGYLLRVDGSVGGERREFLVAIGKTAQVKHALRVGGEVSGVSEAVQDPRTEVAGLYKTAKLTVTNRPAPDRSLPPPWLDVPPALEVYRERGHRRLDPKTYERKCRACMWGAKMAVQMIIDPWKPINVPTNVKWRVETFCYGPKSCSLYRAGETRFVPGRNGMIWQEPDWVSEAATSHRADDD